MQAAGRQNDRKKANEEEGQDKKFTEDEWMNQASSNNNGDQEDAWSKAKQETPAPSDDKKDE